MDAATLSRIATVVAQVDGTEQRCTPCWMAAHVACERGTCACSDELHNCDGPAVQGEAVENRAGSAAQKAG